MKTLLLISLAGTAVSGAIWTREPPRAPPETSGYVAHEPNSEELDRKRKRDGGEESEEDFTNLAP